MSIAKIEAMSHRAVSELMGAAAMEIAAESAWAWREAAKAATDEYADNLAAEVASGRAPVSDDPAEIRRRIDGRPRVGALPT